MLAVLACSWLLLQGPADHPRPDLARGLWRPLRDGWTSAGASTVTCTVELPGAWAGKRLFLCGAGVFGVARLELAGRPLLQHDGGAGSFAVELPGELAGGSVPLALVLATPDQATGRELWLEARGAAWVDSLRVTTLADAPGRARVQIELGGAASAVGRVRVVCPGAQPEEQDLVAGTAILELPSARPWSLSDPQLLPFELWVHGTKDEPIDCVRSRLGLARWSADASGVSLNGQPCYVRGAVLDRDLADPETRLRMLKALGFNTLVVRQATPRLSARADELGMALLVDLLGQPESVARAVLARGGSHPAILPAGIQVQEFAAAATPAPGALATLRLGFGADISWPLQQLLGAVRADARWRGFLFMDLPVFATPDLGFLELSPHMTLADLFGPVHLATGLPLVTRARPGQEIAVPLILAFDPEGPSARTVRVHGHVTGFDDRGLEVNLSSRRGGAAEPRVAGVVAPPPLRLRLPEREGVFHLGVWATVPSDQPADRRFGGRVVARNVCCVDTRQERPLMARVDGRELVLPFPPERWWHLEAHTALSHQSQVSWPRTGAITFRLAVPPVEEIEGLTFRCEASACRDATAGGVSKGRLLVTIQGQDMEPIELPDDTADARGFLSHQARWQTGSQGRLCRIDIEGVEAEALLEKARAAGFFEVTLRSIGLDEAGEAAGMRLFGAHGGRYPFDPELSIRCRRPPKPFAGLPVLTPPAPVELVRAEDPWRTETRPASGPAWLQHRFEAPAAGAAGRLWLRLEGGGDHEVFLDGNLVLYLADAPPDPVEALLPPTLALTPGSHVLAVRGRPLTLRSRPSR